MMMLQKIKKIRVEGNAYECGKQIGEQAEREIHHALKVYERLFMDVNKKLV
jgi:hypothetical protein